VSLWRRQTRYHFTPGVTIKTIRIEEEEETYQILIIKIKYLSK
jgi:hypothetical protein